MELDPRVADGLPFEPKQQDALLGYILKNPSFFLQVKDRVRGTWFLDGWSAKAYEAYCKFYSKYAHTPASDEEFLGWDDVMTLDPLERAKVRNTILRARSETSNYSLDVLREGLTGWLQARVYHQYVTESAALFNNRKFGAAKGLLAKAVQELQNISFDGAPPADYSDPRALVSQILADSSNALTLGHPLLDRTINPDCSKGSLLLGDTTVLMSPTNIGKTTAMVSAIAANLMDNQPVLFVHHEGRLADIMEKLWINMLDVNKATFRKLAMSNDPAVEQTMRMISKLLTKNLIHIDMQRPGLTVEEVVSTVRNHNERMKNERGHGIRLFVNDYPALLNTEQSSNVRMERRQKDAYVYRYLVDYAGNEKMHGLFAVQTNREGSKVNRRVGEHRNKRQLITLEYVQEAYEITNSATNLITLNRSPQDALQEVVTFLICKSRSSETNVGVACRSNYRHGRTHHPSLPATIFRGTEGVDHLDSLLVEYAGREIPADRMVFSGN
jgi:replicative DNA helicase